MLIFTKTADLRAHISGLKQEGKTLGFVPTMGALHEGHLSLILSSKKKCDFTICSIFVNPTQFNDPADLEKYPRSPENDKVLLEKRGCNILFTPTVNEIYDGETKQDFDFGILDKILEGKYRPGHFNGVARVVNRFFEIIEPDKAYFGSKDFQQVLIVKSLVQQQKFSTQIISCPILREPDGLAMSSRNVLLSTNERKLAGNIPKLLEASNKIALENSFVNAKKFLADEIAKLSDVTLDYYEFCDVETLQIISEFNASKKSIALIAVFVGKIRLIDNLILN